MGLSALPFLLAFFLFSPPMLQRDVVTLLAALILSPSLFTPHASVSGNHPKLNYLNSGPLFSPVRANNNLYSFFFWGGADGSECFSA